MSPITDDSSHDHDSRGKPDLPRAASPIEIDAIHEKSIRCGAFTKPNRRSRRLVEPPACVKPTEAAHLEPGRGRPFEWPLHVPPRFLKTTLAVDLERDLLQLGRDARGADLAETRAACEDFAECRTCLMCVRCRATVAFFTVCFLIFTCLTAGLALICCAGTLLTGAALWRGQVPRTW